MELIELQKIVGCFEYANKLKSLIAPVNTFANAPANAILSGLQIQILGIIEEDPLVSYEDIALKSGKDRSTIRRNIQKLKSLGVLQKLGSDKKRNVENRENFIT